ncbi:hypothetical protein DL765_006670 [Monosporascus sp. GIB2]|nr:hypothetical protein DL765_006670 [Monosporascus sp. GIB2]
MDSPWLKRQGSQETLMSLLELDPTPMESEDDLSRQLGGSTIKSQNSTSSSLGLSGSGHGAIYYLTRIQRYSSYTFTFFAGLHITNTSLIPLIYRSVPRSEPFLVMARELYQTPLTEPLLVGLPVLAHVSSGIALRLVRRHQNRKRYGEHKGSALPLPSISSSSGSNGGRRIPSPWPSFNNISISGYLFATVFAAHVAMNRVLPLLVEGDSSNVGLQYVAHGFARHARAHAPGLLRVQGWAAYAALLSLGVGHMVWGWAKWLGVAPPAGWKKTTFDRRMRTKRRRAWWTIQGVVVAVAGLWAAGGLGVVARAGAAEGWLGGVYDGIYSRAWQ